MKYILNQEDMTILAEFMWVKYGPHTGLQTGYQNLLESIFDLPSVSRVLYFAKLLEFGFYSSWFKTGLQSLFVAGGSYEIREF